MLFRSDRKSTRLNSSHLVISYAVFCLKKKKKQIDKVDKIYDQPRDVGARLVTLDVRPRVCVFFALIAWHSAPSAILSFCFFFNDTATTEIYTLSLHDALPISFDNFLSLCSRASYYKNFFHIIRSEEHTSELQSPCNLVCRLLLEKKKKHK